VTFEHVASPVPGEAELEALWERAQELAAESISPNYARRLRREEGSWIAWCEARGVSAVPTTLTMVCRYIADRGLAGLVSLGAALVAITDAHHRAGFVSPVGPGRRPEALKKLLHANRVGHRDRRRGDRRRNLPQRRHPGTPG
jgi:hypothetical protein